MPDYIYHPKNITIYDIAKEAEVSPATVSRFLTGNSKVSAERAERIHAIIEKYNFKPNAMARSLSDTKSKTIGVLAADIRNPYYASLYLACEQAAREKSYTTILCNSLGNASEEKELLDMLLGQRVTAIIQLGGRVDDVTSDESYVEVVNQILRTTPVICTGKIEGAKINTVRLDAFEAMDKIMRHLFDLGHTRIALVGGRLNVLSTFEKYQRYKQMLKDEGLEVDPNLTATAPDGVNGYDFESGYRLANELINRNVDFTAIVAINDFSAMGVLKALNEHGISVPKDVSLASYDNTYMAEMSFPRLTSVDYNYSEYGRKLVDSALAAIENRKVSRLRTIEPQLVIRDSTGPAAK